MKLKQYSGVISTLSILALILSGCSMKQNHDFELLLSDTGELVLCASDIKSFDSEQMVLELNYNGIERWNVFTPKGVSPNIADSLHTRDFVIKLKGEELVRGKFWSLASSMMYSELVIVDSLFQKNQEFNKLFILYGYPASPPNTKKDTGTFDAVKEALTQYFYTAGLLGETSG